MLNGVLDQTADCLGDSCAVSAGVSLSTGDDGEFHTGLLGGRGEDVHHFLGEALKAKRPLVKLHAAMLQAGDQQEVVDHPQEPVGVPLANPEGFKLGLAGLPQPAFFQQV